MRDGQGSWGGFLDGSSSEEGGDRRRDGNWGGVESDQAGQAVGGAFDQDVEDVGESQHDQYGEAPGEDIPEVRNGKTGIENQTLGVDEVEGIAPSAGSDEEPIGSTVAAVFDFVFYPEISEDAESAHGDGVGDFGFEVKHLG